MKRNICLFVMSAFVLIGCATSFSGLEPLYPKAGHPKFPTTIESLQPTFRWKPLPESDVTYDFVIYQCIISVVKFRGGEGVTRTVGPEIYYREGLKEAEHKIEESLKPDGEYYWSVRKRIGQNVSGWSLYNYTLVLPTGVQQATNLPFLFKTPKE